MVDQSGRVSVNEFTTSLEGALLTEGKSNNCKPIQALSIVTLGYSCKVSLFIPSQSVLCNLTLSTDCKIYFTACMATFPVAVLRQIALKTFHSEIHSLRSQVQQVSMERDTLQHSLNRTMEDKQKLVLMGEEQVDMVTKNTDKKLK